MYKPTSPLEQAQRTFLPVEGQLVVPLYLRRAVPLQPGRTYMLGFSMLVRFSPPPRNGPR